MKALYASETPGGAALDDGSDGSAGISKTACVFRRGGYIN